jgi:hypothetical protein
MSTNTPGMLQSQPNHRTEEMVRRKFRHRADCIANRMYDFPKMEYSTFGIYQDPMFLKEVCNLKKVVVLYYPYSGWGHTVCIKRKCLKCIYCEALDEYDE